MTQKEKTRIMWEAREKLAPGIHAQEKVARNPIMRKMIAVDPTNVPKAFPRTADAEFTKFMSIWTCHKAYGYRNHLSLKK
jgi:hypothetical protein